MTPKTRITSLTLGALGVVFGDIGTSPLYTLHECTSGDHGAAPTPENVEGVLSLIFVANLLKFFEGGYVPLLAGSVFLFLMLTWKRGRGLLAGYVSQFTPPMSTFLDQVGSLARVPGTGIYLASNRDRVPPPLFHHAVRMRMLPKTVVLFTVVTEHTPTSKAAHQLETKDLGEGFYRAIARCGFMETPNVPALVNKALGLLELSYQPDELTYYLGRETFLATKRGKMGALRESVFAFLSNNAAPATLFFGIPPEQVVELGTQVDL